MFEKIDDIDIYYETAGEGRPVLLLHGWGCSTQTFKPVADRLQDAYRVYTIDFPGHGQSGLPNRPFDVGDYARITGEFMQRMGITGCDVIAHSFGGRVVLKMAAQSSGNFGKIVITGGAGIRPPRGFTYYRKVYTYKLCKRLAKVGFIRGLLKLFGVDIQKKIADAGSADYKVLPDVMRATFSKVVNEDLSKHLGDIHNSTLLVWGADDTETPLWMAEKMEAHIKDSGLVKFDGAGHFAYLDRLADFIVIVRHFLGGNDKQG